jgi:lysozyme family protein
MSQKRFDVCHPITAKWEGGWSNHAADPGGKTMYGVTEKNFHKWLRSQGEPIRSVRTITMDEALRIYYEWFWVPTAGTYNLFPGVDLACYDASVNSGVGRGIEWLKKASGSTDHAETVKRLCRARLSFMQSLRIWKTFGRGWARRVADIEARGVAMAVEAMSKGNAELKRLKQKERMYSESAKAKKAAKSKEKGAVASSVGSGGSVAAGPDTTQVADWAPYLFYGLGGVLVLVVLYFVLQAYIERARQDAYAEVYSEV